MAKSTVGKLADGFDQLAQAGYPDTDETAAYRRAADAAREVDGKTVSDGYHTFGELYAHRRALMLVLMRSHPADSWRSREHHPADGPMFDGDFIVGIDAPTGGIRYHVGVEHWSMFDFAITLPHAPKWDGAGPDATVERLLTWRPNEWDCVAYGPEGTKVGALCFFSADLGDRDCATRGQCSRRMAAERGRVHGRIGEMAAAGDPVGVMLAEEFPTPDGLLNSDRPADAGDDDPGSRTGDPAVDDVLDVLDRDRGADDDEPDRDGADEQETEPFRTDHGDPLG
jgi:hypothetical protein